VLTEIKNRGTDDVCIVVCDGLKGLPESIAATWPMAITQTCVLHLIRNTFRFASRTDWDKIAKDLRPVYTAVNKADALKRLDEFDEIWGEKYPAIRVLWDAAWEEFIPSVDEGLDPHAALCLYANVARLSPPGHDTITSKADTEPPPNHHPRPTTPQNRSLTPVHCRTLRRVSSDHLVTQQ